MKARDIRKIIEEVWKPYKYKWKKLYDYNFIPDDFLQALTKAILKTEKLKEKEMRDCCTCKENGIPPCISIINVVNYLTKEGQEYEY